MKLALVGSKGFVGSAIARAAGDFQISSVPGIRLPSANANAYLGRSVAGWIHAHPTEFADLISRLEGNEVVVNAAGLADPQSHDTGALIAANGLLPGLIAEAAVRAGVRRLVHISSAAVQGNRDPLDESSQLSPFSPYSKSKAVGERALLDGDIRTPDEVVVYRPTSVQGPDRAVTAALVRFCRRPVLPLCGNGEASVPLALVDNAAAAVLHLTRSTSPTGVVLHPWEGVTLRSLFEAFGDGPRFVQIPRSAARGLLMPLRSAAQIDPAAAAVLRRVELLTLGQGQDARALEAAGFEVGHDMDAYRRLARAVPVPESRRRWRSAR